MVLVRFNKDTKVWDIIEKENSIEGDLYLDGFLKKKLDFAKAQLKRNNDVVGTISGDEGSGKSTIAANIMRYMTDDRFNPQTDMIGAEPDDEVMDKIEKTSSRGALMFDEGNSYFLSTETMKREQRDLHKLFSIFRQKNLFVLIIAPSFFRLSSYFALDRSRFHIRTYIQNNTWGFFKYYGDKRKGTLYRVGKKFHDYEVIKANFKGRFTKCFALETPEYKEYKARTLKNTFASFRKAKQKVPTETEIKRALINTMIKNNPTIPTEELSNALGLSIRRVNQLKLNIKKEMVEPVHNGNHSA